MIAATAASDSCQLALLHAEILLLLDQQLERLEVLQLRAEFAIVQRAANVDPLLDHREGQFQLGDGRGSGRALGLLLRPLLVEGGDLGTVLRNLAGQKLALHGDELRARACGRLEIDYRILGVRQRSPEPGNVELGRDQVALDMVALGKIHGGVELDEHVARLHRHAVAHVNGAHHSRLVRLNGLGATAGDDLAGCRGDDVDLAECRPSQREAEQGNDRHPDRPPRGRGRRLHYLQRGREKCDLIPIAAIARGKRNNPSGLRGFRLHGVRLHGCHLACGKRRHNYLARWCRALGSGLQLARAQTLCRGFPLFRLSWHRRCG